jgi:hypothetical protein
MPLVARCMNQRASLVRSASTGSMKLQVKLMKGKGPRCARRMMETASVIAAEMTPWRAGRRPV